METVSASRSHGGVQGVYDAKVAEIRIGQGGKDGFMAEQLRPSLLVSPCSDACLPLTLRMRGGYDHNDYFILSFMPDQLRWHTERLA